MAKREKVQKAKVQYQLNGQGPKISFEFTALGQKSLDKAIEFYNDRYSSKGAALVWAGKLEIGKVWLSLSDDCKDTKKKNSIHLSIFPNLTGTQLSNFKKLYKLNTGAIEDVSWTFAQWKNKNFKNLNSETHILQKFRNHSARLDTMKNEAFVIWYNMDIQAPEKLSTSEILEKHSIDFSTCKTYVESYEKYVAEQQEKDKDGEESSGGGENTNDLKPEKAVDMFKNACAQLVINNNKALLDDEMKKEIQRHWDSVVQSLWKVDKAA